MGNSATENLILAELRALHRKVDALATPAARAARRELEAQEAEALEAEQNRTRKANHATAEKAVAIAAGQDACRNPHGAKGNGLEHP